MSRNQPMLVKYTSTVSFPPKFGTSQKGNEYVMFSLNSLGAKRPEGGYHNLSVSCFSTDVEVRKLLNKVTVKDDVITVAGEASLDCFKTKDGKEKVSFKVFVKRAWLGGPDDENEPIATATEEQAQYDPDDESSIPF